MMNDYLKICLLRTCRTWLWQMNQLLLNYLEFINNYEYQFQRNIKIIYKFMALADKNCQQHSIPSTVFGAYLITNWIFLITN